MEGKRSRVFSLTHSDHLMHYTHTIREKTEIKGEEQQGGGIVEP
jgi:hypothetical protein